jgi:ribonucleoside-triphosphate reductase
METCKLTNIKDNTNKYSSAACAIFNDGVQINKAKISKYFNKEENDLLNNCEIYIHDSEFFDITINCCSISLEHIFKNGLSVNGILLEKPTTIFEIFSQLQIFIINIENEISGGLTLVNFDHELANLMKELNIITPTKSELYNHIGSLFKIINFANSRYGNQSPYVSFTIGIIQDDYASDICAAILEVLLDGADKGKPYIFPNMHFRVKSGINKNSNDPYYNLYVLAQKSTSFQMNPTYILADSDMNKNIDPFHLHVVGCRSRLLETTSQEKHGIGRINIGAISVNLPGIAMKSNGLDTFITTLRKNIEISINILLTKSNLLNQSLLKHSSIIKNNNIFYPFNHDISSIINQASMSIGFIGAHEMCEILSPNSTLEEKSTLINTVLQYMYSICQELSTKHQRIFTLIGVSGEGISSYFPSFDMNQPYSFSHICAKGYYTNSFHVPVFEKVNPIQKIILEGTHHQHCNGGCITYIEVSHIKENTEAFEDILKLAEINNLHYVGFNFEKNICNECGCETNKIDFCNSCGSNNITAIRRVSGYLGYLNSFSNGKKLEEKSRVCHTTILQEN